MATEKILEIGMRIGDYYWKLSELIVNQKSKDATWVLPIPDVGLHLSIHRPKSSMKPNWHLHWKSHNLDIEEDIDENFLSPSYWKKSVLDFLDIF